MRQIKLDNTYKQSLIQKFTEYINNAKLTENEIRFTAEVPKTVPENIEKPTIYIEADAYMKMMLYVRDTSTEIAWHGTVNRNGMQFQITDVFLYPQTLAAATVTTDQEKYNTWIEKLDDETLNHMRFQGHSHVNFGVTPSGTDLQYYNDMLQILPSNDFYIFMILNKSGNTTWLLYDLQSNTIYNTEDITVYIVTLHDNDTMDTIKQEKEKYCTKPVSFYNTTYANPTIDYKNYNKFKNDLDYFANRDLPKYNKAPYQEIEEMSETDKIFADLDKKYSNIKLKKKKHKGDIK